MLNRFVNKIRKICNGGEKYATTYAIDQSRKIGVTVGKNCRFYSMNFSSEPYLIEIGDHVTITEDVKFITHDGATWVLRGMKKEYKDVNILGRIVIGNNVFIGNNAILLPGIEIGDNTIIAAGSVVTKSFTGNEIIAGVPAKTICSIDEYIEKNKNFFVNTKHLSSQEKKELIVSSISNIKLKKK